MKIVIQFFSVFGSQLVDIHYNRLKNPLMDFEVVAGATPKIYSLDVMNVTYNWFGVSNEAGVGQRVFDLDDWNIYTIANYTPFYTSEEQFINFWWNPPIVSLFWRDAQHCLLVVYM